jgi:TPP-dependent 2-oxoacid decarboxylase
MQFRDAVVALFRSKKPLLSRRRPNISNETIKTTLSSTETVREVKRTSSSVIIMTGVRISNIETGTMTSKLKPRNNIIL